MCRMQKKTLRVLIIASLLGLGLSASQQTLASATALPMRTFTQEAIVQVAGWGKSAPKVRADFNKAASPRLKSTEVKSSSGKTETPVSGKQGVYTAPSSFSGPTLGGAPRKGPR